MTDEERYDDDIIWCRDNGSMDWHDELDSIVDSMWDDFDESDYIESNYSLEGLWDAIRNNVTYDDFLDEMREQVDKDAYDAFSDGMEDYDSYGEFEVCGYVYSRLKVLDVVF